MIGDLDYVLDRARPFVDEGFAGKGWKPSELLEIGYCILATGKADDGVDQGLAYIERHLDIARERWLDGFIANPFSVEPIPRP